MVELRPPIPDPLARAVRKKCGFGCIVCGAPIFEYDHMIPWEIVKEHTLQNLFLLCPNHHRDKTSGRMPLSDLEYFARHPVNVGALSTSGHRLFFGRESGSIIVGGSEYNFDIDTLPNNRFNAIVLEGKPVVYVEFEERRILLSFQLQMPDGRLALSIDRGELRTSTGVWDYDYSGSSLIIRSKLYSIDIYLSFEYGTINIMRGYIFGNYVRLKIMDDRIRAFNPLGHFDLIRCQLSGAESGVTF